MKTAELRKKYIEFFKSKGHKEIPGASLIPENDPTVLFTTAGMHPLVPYLLGEKHPAGKKLVDVQKCVRTTDIKEVGDDWHLTFFEMLGNWSLGDYFKKEAIEMSWEFLTSKKWLKIPKEKLAVSVFAGDPDFKSGQFHLGGGPATSEVSDSGEAGDEVPADEEAAKIWLNLGIPKERIAYLGREENWWGPAGETGPCGPCTEMFYWSGEGESPREFDPKDKRWVEIWNDVFMQYNKRRKEAFSGVDKKQIINNSSNTPRIKADGDADLRGNGYEYVPLKQKNIDTGMGLERAVAVLNGCKSVYEIDEFQEIMNALCDSFAIQKNQRDEFVLGNKTALRIIVDHMRAAIFIAAADVLPSNKERGYILRRLIRRSVVYARNFSGDPDLKSGRWISEIAKKTRELYGDLYPEVKNNEIEKILIDEAEKFKRTVADGLRRFEKLKKVDGKAAFDLYQSYGFPIELTEELARKGGFDIDRQIFYDEFKKHQKISRAGLEKKFKGGLADASEISKKYHTATHLLHAALRKVLGERVAQKGSNITAERLRFDFSYEGKMTTEQIKQVENLVNEQIKKDLPVKMEEMSVERAKKSGALGFFEHKYGERVKVYTIDDLDLKSGQAFSKEICGGPHVRNAGELGHFKIVKEEAVSAGIRRIKAVLG